MSEGSSPVRDVAETVKGIAEAVPVYQDLLQPAVQEIGKALATVAKLTHVALAPVASLVWGYDEIRDLVTTRVAAKLASTPPDQIVPPAAYVAGPALEALRWSGSEEALREMYANLLATSIDARTAENAHPGFVEIIKQLTPDEAKLLSHFSTTDSLPIVSIRAYEKGNTKYFDIYQNFTPVGEDAGCQHEHLTPQYLDNISRLGLINIMSGTSYANDDIYKTIEDREDIQDLKRNVEEQLDRRVRIVRGMIEVTKLGKQFIESCVVDRLVSTESEHES